MRKNIVAALIAILASSTLAAQSAPDAKGWHGAEWGMKIDQVRQAAGLSLTGPRVPPVPGVVCYDAPDIDISEWKATASFCFGDDGFKEDELTHVVISWREGTSRLATYNKLRDELKSKYGEPTSEQHNPGKYGASDHRAKWLLANTELRCSTNIINDQQFLNVSYSRRKPNPF